MRSRGFLRNDAFAAQEVGGGRSRKPSGAGRPTPARPIPQPAPLAAALALLGDGGGSQSGSGGTFASRAHVSPKAATDRTRRPTEHFRRRSRMDLRRSRHLALR
jgi:hypothetical protein